MTIMRERSRECVREKERERERERERKGVKERERASSRALMRPAVVPSRTIRLARPSALIAVKLRNVD